ncbi:hypothetical protein MF6394_14185 [Pseudomonas sp. MF6394]|nr:hypothetical protein MF6394_14185 [Pseudomonas sp. MF6394]
MTRNSQMNAFLMLGPRFSQNALSGGLLKPSIPKSPPSYVYTLLSQCLTFQRAQSALIFFMSGLRDLFVWKQKATTDAPDTHNA